MSDDFDRESGLRLLYRFENGHEVYFTTKVEGDARELISCGAAERELGERVGRAIRLGRLNQIHSGIVHLIGCGERQEADSSLPDGDGLVACSGDFGLGVLVADCAPVALTSAEGIFAAVHAGWQGVSKGVLPEAAAAMRSMGASEISAYVGPCIRSECYEFKGPELWEISRELGGSVVGRTSWDTVSLDLLEAVRRSLAKAGVGNVEASQACTACGDEYYSFRARQSQERHLMVVVPGGGY
ncbi:MAG: polyphenol oxidase family protein [Actinomycetota bacterium]|nr:polyphenol oxidase family protein [Actinomycetota bacterium]